MSFWQISTSIFQCKKELFKLQPLQLYIWDEKNKKTGTAVILLTCWSSISWEPPAPVPLVVGFSQEWRDESLSLFLCPELELLSEEGREETKRLISKSSPQKLFSATSFCALAGLKGFRKEEYTYPLRTGYQSKKIENNKMLLNHFMQLSVRHKQTDGARMKRNQ